ncbi:hypothetical protein QUF50_09540 [Thiotrichales bacterium HSG1]|nr:hypothetical protein [Thiotrichales bacterium HSG1]
MINTDEIGVNFEHDNELDLLIAHFGEIKNPLETEETPFYENILFKVDSKTGELVQVLIYDFSAFRRHLLTQLIFLYTRKTIKNWLKVLVAGFKVGEHTHKLVDKIAITH